MSWNLQMISVFFSLSLPYSVDPSTGIQDEYLHLFISSLSLPSFPLSFSHSLSVSIHPPHLPQHKIYILYLMPYWSRSNLFFHRTPPSHTPLQPIARADNLDQMPWQLYIICIIFIATINLPTSGDCCWQPPLLFQEHSFNLNWLFVRFIPPSIV